MNTTQSTTEPISITTIEQIYGPGEGRHWFDPDTLRFFGSRLASYGYQGPGGIYFVSSETDMRCLNRAFTVRQLVGPGDINTVGEFRGHTRSSAHAEAKRLAAGGTKL